MAIAPHDPTAKAVTLLGSTGSIGKNTIKIMEESSALFHVETLTAHQNVALLAEQAMRLKAEKAVISDPSLYQDLKERLQGSSVIAAAGTEAMIEAASEARAIVVVAVMGAAGLAPTIAAIRQGRVIAMANKECLVCAGELLMKEASHYRATIIPVDSEHNAIFQVFDFNQPEHVEKVTLTASGGPFRTWTKAEMQHVTPAQAVLHPNWQMGTKISVDSATMMNKGLELIEAYHLFPVRADQIDIVVHPESIIHSMVSYCDGSVLAQLNTPDMCVPIAFALAWPRRIDLRKPALDLAGMGKLTFEYPDTEKFPALRLARAALTEGKSAPTILNAANEVAVESFIREEIGFLAIAETVEKTLQTLHVQTLTSLEDVAHADKEARNIARALIQKHPVSVS